MKNKDIMAGKEEIYDFRYLQITLLSTQNIQNNLHGFRIKGDLSKAIEYEIKRQMSVAFLYTSNKIRKGNIKKVIIVIARQYYRITTIKPIKDTR